MALSSNHAFLLVIAGCLALYYELIRPGSYLSAILGAVGILTGFYELSGYGMTGWGLSLITGSIALFGLEMLRKTYLVAGFVGTALLVSGFCLLVPGRAAISPVLAVPVCLLFGLFTSFLAGVIRRGLENKRNFSSREAYS